MRHSKKYLIRSFWIFTAIVLYGANAWSAEGNNVSVTYDLSHPYILSAEDQTIYLKVGLKGIVTEAGKQRPPVNISLVIDKSGSMSGQKISDVRDASKMLIDRLKPTDILSIVTYDDGVNVLVPATKLENPETIKARVDEIFAGGSTALYSGVQTGAKEVGKFLSDNQVNRVILLSDGLANIGPSQPDDLGRLGAQLIQRGISVSTIGIGLGYNEDLMAQLAAASDGFHQFAEHTEQLNKLFDWEFGKLGSIVANDVDVRLAFADGVRPVRILGREGDVSGKEVNVKINQIFGSHEIYVLVEAKINSSFAGNGQADIATANVNFYNLDAKASEKRSHTVTASFTDNKTMVNNNINTDVMIAAAEQKAAVEQAEAIQLRDQGQAQAAQIKLEAASEDLKQAGKFFNSERLKEYGQILLESSRTIVDDAEWNKNRKSNTETLKKVTFTTN